MNIIKRKGKKEKYDERKVYASVYAAVLNCDYEEKKSEILALKITKLVNTWLKKQKKSLDSKEIREFIIKTLVNEDKDVALMYKHHLDLS